MEGQWSSDGKDGDRLPGSDAHQLGTRLQHFTHFVLAPPPQASRPAGSGRRGLLCAHLKVGQLLCTDPVKWAKEVGSSGTLSSTRSWCQQPRHRSRPAAPRPARPVFQATVSAARSGFCSPAAACLRRPSPCVPRQVRATSWRTFSPGSQPKL